MILAIPESHRWSKEKEVSMDSLKGETLLMLADGHCLRDQAMGFCFAAGANEDARFRATSLETLRNMVAAETGITLLPKLSVPESMHRDGVVYVKAVGPEPQRLITLDYRPGSPLRARYEKLASVIADAMKSMCNAVE